MKGTPLYCTNCGSKLCTGTEACPACGQSTKVATSLETAGMPLFDQRRRYYVVEVSGGQWPKEILDQDGNTIGFMQLRPPSRRLEFLETDGTTVSAILEPKQNHLSIKDGGDRLLGYAQIEGSVLPVAHLEDAGGKRMCQAKCYKWASISWKYEAHDPKGGLVAEMDRVSRRNDKCAVVVHGDSIDRRLLVPFAVVTMNFLSKRRGKPSAIGLLAGGMP